MTIMQSKGNAPNAAQKVFRENLRELFPGVIHHCVGATAKIKGVGNIGHWWIVSVPVDRHNKIHASGKMRKTMEKALFKYQMTQYFEHYLEMPVANDVLQAIEDWHL